MATVYTIGIGGPSCSGKTTITRILRQILKNVTIIYQDDYYKPDELVPIDEKTQLKNWDCPESVDFVAMAKMIEYARNNDGQLPPDFNSNEERNVHDGSSLLDSETAKKLENILEHLANNESVRFVIVDGFMLYWDKAVYDQLDCKISCMASYESLKERRSARQGYNTVDGYWVDPPGYFDALVWPEYVRLNKHVFEGNSHSVSEHESIDGVFNVNTDVISVNETAIQVANKVKDVFSK